MGINKRGLFRFGVAASSISADRSLTKKGSHSDITRWDKIVPSKACYIAERRGPAAAPKINISDAEVCLLCEDNMAKRTIWTTTKSPRKVSKTALKSIKKQAKQRAAAEKGAPKMVAPPSGAVTLTGRQARVEERFRELVAWYILQGVDEATARRRAQDEIDDDPRQD